MLFSDDEIKNLKIFGNLAVIANVVNERSKNEEFTLLKNELNFEYPVDIFFDELKYNILNLDNILINSTYILHSIQDKLNIIREKFSDYILITSFSNYDLLILFVKYIKDFLGESRLMDPNKTYDEHALLYTMNDEVYAFNYHINSIDLLSRSFYKSENDYNKKIILLEDQLNKILDRIRIQEELLENGVSNFLEPSKKKLLKQASDLIKEFNIELGTMQGEVVYTIKEKIQEIDTTVKDIDKDIKLTVKDYEILKKLINAKGEQQITDHYKKRAFWERITYWLMTIGTFAIIIWSICLALNGLDEYKAKTNISISSMVQQYKEQPIEKIEKMYSVIQNNALTYLVLRLIFSVLLFSSIIYTSRVAYRAYVHMRHSENMMLKLATLRPFINQLEEEDRNQIHKDLVPDYFGKDAGMVDSTNEKFKDLPANVSAVAMKAIEQISGSSNSSGTEKNGKKPEGGTE